MHHTKYFTTQQKIRPLFIDTVTNTSHKVTNYVSKQSFMRTCSNVLAWAHFPSPARTPPPTTREPPSLPNMFKRIHLDLTIEGPPYSALGPAEKRAVGIPLKCLHAFIVRLPKSTFYCSTGRYESFHLVKKLKCENEIEPSSDYNCSSFCNVLSC